MKKRFEGAGTKAYETKKEYQKKNYYRFNVVIKKEMRETIEAAAEKMGMSKNAFVNQAIQKEIDRVNHL